MNDHWICSAMAQEQTMIPRMKQRRLPFPLAWRAAALNSTTNLAGWIAMA